MATKKDASKRASDGREPIPLDNWMVKFLKEAARYFQNASCESNEDRGFWAHKNNAENCLKIADYISDPRNDTYYLCMILAEIREKTGVGMKPMLSELADAIVHRYTKPKTKHRKETL